MKKKELDADKLAERLAAEEEANAYNTDESPIPTLGKKADHYHNTVWCYMGLRISLKQ